MQRDEYIIKLGDKNPKKRLKYAKKLGKLLKKDKSPADWTRGCCGFIHSEYSFSPYTPATAAYMAYNNRLKCAGLVDTGTLAGREEFLTAAGYFGLDVLSGVGYSTLLPVPFRDLCNVQSRDYSRFIYLAGFGFPSVGIKKIDGFLAEYRKERQECNRKTLVQINGQFKELGNLSYETDVLPVTKAEEGGSVTRTHVMLALARRLMRLVGTQNALVDYLTKVQNFSLSTRETDILLSPVGRNYEFDLCAILSRKLKVDDEQYTSKVHKFVGAVLAAGGFVIYPVNEKEVIAGGEKYMDDMIRLLKQMNVSGVAYKASALGDALALFEKKCREAELLVLDGTDIRYARDLFYTGDMTAAQELCFYAMRGNTYLAEQDLMDSFYGPRTEKRFPDIGKRLEVFAEVGRKL